MYLSDLFVTAYKTGSQERVENLFEILLNLPDDWWEFRGCKNWLRVAFVQYQNDPDKFIGSLEKYIEGSDWANGKPFITLEEASADV